MDSCRIQPETNEHMCEFAHSLICWYCCVIRECKSGIVALDFPKNSNAENARDFIFLWRAFTFVVRRLLCCAVQ